MGDYHSNTEIELGLAPIEFHLAFSSKWNLWIKSYKDYWYLKLWKGISNIRKWIARHRNGIMPVGIKLIDL